MFRRMPWLLLAFAAGLCLAGMPGWIAPRGNAGPFDPLVIAGLAGLSALAMMLVVGAIAPPLRAWTVMALCPPAVAAIRAVAEMPAPLIGAGDVGVASLVGAAVVAPGIFGGLLVQRLQRARPGV